MCTREYATVPAIGTTTGPASGIAEVTPVANANADAAWPDGNEKVRGSGSKGAAEPMKSLAGRSRCQANFSGPFTSVAAIPMPMSPLAAAVRGRRRPVAVSTPATATHSIDRLATPLAVVMIRSRTGERPAIAAASN